MYVWGTDVNGGNMDAKHHAFTGTDCWGKVAVLNFDGKYDKFGFLVTTMGFIAGSTLILGDHSRGLPRLARTAIAFAIGFGLLVWAGFTLLLNVPVPEGMFL